MNRARQAILGAALTDVDPARILQQANRSLTALEAGMVTAACCVYDSQTLTLAYATAGHPPPIVVPAGGPAFALPSGGPPLGIVTDLELGSTQHTVAAGTMVILYTDGLIEEGRDVIVDERRLLAIAERHRTSPEAAAAIFGAMLPEQHPRDDVAILTMRIGPQR
jgi:serine phosphatase RsbU (regulator of sigma subunit)